MINKLNSTLRRRGASALLVALLCSSSAITPAFGAPKAKKHKVRHNECEEVVASIGKAWPVEIDIAVNRVQQMMLEHKDCACEIATASFYAAPKEAGKPDPRLIAALLRGILATDYQDIPESQCDVRGLVLTAVRAANGGGGSGKEVVDKEVVGKEVVGDVDCRTLTLIAAAGLPVVFAYEPALVDSIVQGLIAEYPGCSGMLTQLRADLIGYPIALTRSGLRTDATVVEPNFKTLSASELRALEAFLLEKAANSP
jgi:hypothetical protein